MTIQTVATNPYQITNSFAARVPAELIAAREEFISALKIKLACEVVLGRVNEIIEKAPIPPGSLLVQPANDSAQRLATENYNSVCNQFLLGLSESERGDLRQAVTSNPLVGSRVVLMGDGYPDFKPGDYCRHKEVDAVAEVADYNRKSALFREQSLKLRF